MSKDKHILIRSKDKRYMVNVNDIVYVEGNGDYINIHHKTCGTIKSHMRIHYILTHLPYTKFMQIHKRYIINLDCVKWFDKDCVCLSSLEYKSIALSIGPSKRDEVNEYFNRYAI